MARTVKKVSHPAPFAMPMGRGGSTFSDSAPMVADRGPLGPASAPNTPDGTQPSMSY